MAMDQLVMNPPSIKSAPCSTAGCKGAVGVPAWFWVDPTSWQPQDATATAGPFTVTVTATPKSVTWNLGDGTSITCHGPGTPYDKSKGWAESPDCGSKYRKAGSYTLSATMNWDVVWAGAANGAQTMTTTSSNPVEIGEYQVVVTGH